MNSLKVLTIALFLIGLVGFSACSIGQNAATQNQLTVAKGDLGVKVNGTGKTGYASDAKLAFGSVGKVKQLNVKMGDAVTKDAVLAQLDSDSLGLALLQARVNESAARAAVNQAQSAITQAQIALTQAETNLSLAQSAKIQAEASVSLAQFNLDRIQAVGNIKDKIVELRTAITTAQENQKLAGATHNAADLQYLNERLPELALELTQKNLDLQKLLAKDEYSNVAPYEIMAFDPVNQVFTLGGQRYDRLLVEDIQMKQQQVELALQGVDQAKLNIKQAEQGIEQAKQNVEKAEDAVEQVKLSLEQAAQAVLVAQKQLDSAVIMAPFDGVIANLGIKQDDFVLGAGLSAGTPIYMVDPASLEVSCEIDELDIADIREGQGAIITLEAVPGQVIEGKVTSISLLPISKQQNSGVVVYEVKVGFAGQPPAWAKPGMSASADILTSERKGILLVPNKAIQQNSQGQKIVNVWVDQKAREQMVVTGLSDGIQTEVISGINEGDIVILNP